MRVFVIDRARLTGDPLVFPTGEFHDPAVTRKTFDDRGLPDGFPFVLDDDGRAVHCWSVNKYLLDAWDQRGLTIQSMRNLAYGFTRALTVIRRFRATAAASGAGQDLATWLEVNGEPAVDLIHVTRQELVAYRDQRALEVEASTLANEMRRLASFYKYARRKQWIEVDPTPRFGANERNTLIPRTRMVRVEKFLSLRQTRSFLEVGLRGDHQVDRPSFPERDYCYGLTLATTGTRRSEAAFLLDLEVPGLPALPDSGVDSLVIKGKKDVERRIYFTRELVSALRLYRDVERAGIVAASQPRLRRLLRSGDLLVVEDLDTYRRAPAVVIDGKKVPTIRLSADDRSRAVLVLPDGTIEPLGLFLSRSGLPPVSPYWNQLFQEARDRIDASDDANKPPSHVTVGPHTLRHTFAVTMLAALMREGRDRASDPYFLIVNPLLTVQQLLGHASVETTQKYLYAAETWHAEVPQSLRGLAANFASTSLGTA